MNYNSRFLRFQNNREKEELLKQKEDMDFLQAMQVLAEQASRKSTEDRSESLGETSSQDESEQ